MGNRIPDKIWTKQFLWLLVCSLALTALTYIVIRRLPSYAPHIIFGIAGLFFLALGFFAGYRRDRSVRDIETDRTLQGVLLFLFFLTVVAFRDGAPESGFLRSLGSSGIAISVIVASALICFFAGLWVHRHWQRARGH